MLLWGVVRVVGAPGFSPGGLVQLEPRSSVACRWPYRTDEFVAFVHGSGAPATMISEASAVPAGGAALQRFASLYPTWVLGPLALEENPGRGSRVFGSVAPFWVATEAYAPVRCRYGGP